MEKLIKKLESKIGYKVELEFDADKEVFVLRSGGNKPPESEAFEKEFQNEEELRKWITQKTKE